MTSTHSKQLTERDGDGDNNKVYAKIIDSFYVVVDDIIWRDGPSWQVILMLFSLCYRRPSVCWGEVVNVDKRSIFWFVSWSINRMHLIHH